MVIGVFGGSLLVLLRCDGSALLVMVVFSGESHSRMLWSSAPFARQTSQGSAVVS